MNFADKLKQQIQKDSEIKTPYNILNEVIDNIRSVTNELVSGAIQSCDDPLKDSIYINARRAVDSAITNMRISNYQDNLGFIDTPFIYHEFIITCKSYSYFKYRVMYLKRQLPNTYPISIILNESISEDLQLNKYLDHTIEIADHAQFEEIINKIMESKTMLTLISQLYTTAMETNTETDTEANTDCEPFLH